VLCVVGAVITTLLQILLTINFKNVGKETVPFHAAKSLLSIY